MIISITENGNEYTFLFVTSAHSTRSGFAHVCELKTFCNGVLLYSGTAKCFYYNRTWEKYRFQSVAKKAIDKAQSVCFEEYKDAYKKANNVEVLRGLHKIEFDDFMRTEEYYNVLGYVWLRLDKKTYEF